MAYAESKSKLGNRGSIRGPKTFSQSSGTQNKREAVQSSWQGTTKGATTHRKKR